MSLVSSIDFSPIVMALNSLKAPIVEMRDTLQKIGFANALGGSGGGGGGGSNLGSGLMKSLGKSFKGIGKMISGALSGALGPIGLLMTVLQPMLDPLMMLIEPFTMLGEVLGSKLYPIITPIVNFLFEIVDGISLLLDFLDPFITMISDWLTENLNLENVINVLIGVFQWLMEVLKPVIDFFKGLITAIQGGWGEVGKFFLGIGLQILEWIKNGLSVLKDFFINFILMIIDWIKQGINAAGNFVANLGAQIWDAITFWD